MKRLRKKCGTKTIRFYMCGEYGSQYGRPHYHAILFNHDFNDKILWQVKRDVPLFISDTLAELWPFGFSTIGNVTFESAAYVARYIMKKVTGDLAEDHYDWVDPETGEIFRRVPEYCTPSTGGGPRAADPRARGGIGRGWFERYGSEVFPDDAVTLKGGRRLRPPRFYEKIVEVTDPELLAEVKGARMRQGRKQAWNATPDRLRVREKVQVAKLQRLKRELD